MDMVRSVYTIAATHRRFIALALALVVVTIAWYGWAHRQDLRLISHVRGASLAGSVPGGVLLQAKGTLVFRDWSGRERWRGSAPVAPTSDEAPPLQYRLSPNGRWYLSMVPVDAGYTSEIVLSHDGREVKRQRVRSCSFAEVRDDGTAWLMSYAGDTLYVCAVRASGVSVGEIKPTLPAGVSAGNSGTLFVSTPWNIRPEAPPYAPCRVETLSADASRLHLNASMINGRSIDFYPAYLNFTVRVAGGRITLRQAENNTTRMYTVTPPTPSSAGAAASIRTLDGKTWYLTEAVTAQTPDGTIAVSVQRETPDSRKAPILRVYEQPGTLRAQQRLPGGAKASYGGMAIQQQQRRLCVGVGNDVYIYGW